MTAAVYNIEDVEITASERRLKEMDILPVPSTTPASRRESASVNHRLAAILQYINPLFYARLAQAFIYSVLESYRGGSSGNYNAPRITAGEMIAVPNPGPVAPADSAAIDCGPPILTEINIDDHFTSVAPEFGNIPHLDSENIETVTLHEPAILADSITITEEQLPEDIGTGDREVAQDDAPVSDMANNTVESAKDDATADVVSLTEDNTGVDQPVHEALPGVSEDQPAGSKSPSHSGIAEASTTVELEENITATSSPPTIEVAKKLAKKNKRGKGKSKNKK